MKPMEVRDQLFDVLTGPIAQLGLDLEAVELSTAGKRRLLRFAVDQDGGVTMDDIAEATKEISRVLDETNVMGEQPYTLEVSSPGVDRLLTLPRHWRRNAGRLVKLTTAGGETLTGRITETTEDDVTLDVTGRRRSLRIDEVTKARVQVEFNRKEAEPLEAEPGDEPDDLTDDQNDDQETDD